MEKQKKVIAIEDHEGLLETYVDVISSEGFQVDTATKLDEALSRISSKTYHVAVVDLQLDKDSRNRDGLKVLKFIHDLDEGTKTIVCSGQDTREVFVEVYENYGISQYIVQPDDKDKIIKTDRVIDKDKFNLDDIISSINKAYENCVIREYGPFTSASKFLSGGKDVLQWEHKCLSIFHPLGGITGLYSFLQELLSPYTPLLPTREAIVPMSIDNDGLKADFWSKGLGGPISIYILPEKSEGEVKLKKNDGRLLTDYRNAKILGLVYELTDGRREMFVERL